MNVQAITQDGTDVDPQTVIFPILKEVNDRINQMIGTGFFLTRIGPFVTAKHVIEDIYDTQTKKQKHPIHAVHFVEGSKVLVRHITAISSHNTSDIIVGKMDYHIVNSTGAPLYNKVPTFSITPVPINSSVVTFAYPDTDKTFTKNESGAFRAGYYDGKFLSHSDKKRDSVVVSWPRYVTSIDVKDGASGGPVFDHLGRVIAVNCVGGIENLSYRARVKELLDLLVPEFPMKGGRQDWPTVKELIEIGTIKFCD
jgi:V8-like Glu-specific endopeptidase